MTSHIKKNLDTYFQSERIKGASFFLNNIERIRHLHHDSRLVNKSSAFIAIRGEHHDGHDYVSSVLRQGVPFVFVDKNFSFTKTKLSKQQQQRLLQVQDTKKFSREVAHLFYDNPSKKCELIGITGTNGKTTVTYLIEALLQRGKNGKGRAASLQSVGVIGTINTRFNDIKQASINTTPLALDVQRLLFEMVVEAGVKSVLIEISSHALATGRSANLHLDKAIFLNISSEHLDFHSSLDDYLQVKLRLFDLLEVSDKPHKQAFFCLDSHFAIDKIKYYVKKNKTSSYQKIFFADKNVICDMPKKTIADFLSLDNKLYGYALTLRKGMWWKKHFRGRIIKSRYELFHSSTIETWQRVLAINTHLMGRFNGQNLTASILAHCGDFSFNKLSSTVIEKSLNTIVVPGRLESMTLKNGGIVFFDYAHTPHALQNALETLRLYYFSRNFFFTATATAKGKGKGKLICLFGCGGDRDVTKRSLMGEIACQYAHKLVVTSDNPRTENPDDIINQILTGVLKEQQRQQNTASATLVACERITNRRQAIEKAVVNLKSNDVLLIAGKGHEDYQVVGTKRIAFNEKEIVIAAMNKVNLK